MLDQDYMMAPCVRCGGLAYFDVLMPDAIWEAITGWPSRTGCAYAETHQDAAVEEMLPDIAWDEVLCDDSIIDAAERSGVVPASSIDLLRNTDVPVAAVLTTTWERQGRRSAR